jgi:uncharacterized membrane protein YeaQ/YmgE (transglycosylase-associated protein family)
MMDRTIIAIVGGLIVGVVALLAIRSRTRTETVITLVLGVVGAFVGAIIVIPLFLPEFFGLLSGTVVAAIVVGIYALKVNKGKSADKIRSAPATKAPGPSVKKASTEWDRRIPGRTGDGPSTPQPKAAPPASGSGVFISYRRSDESNFAGRLYERFLRTYETSRIFMDVDSIELGVDFQEVIDRWLEQCSVMLVVIGNKWLDAATPDGSRRLDNPDDFVRIEVASALARPGVRVIPVLVDGASVPSAADLPDPLKPLARRNGLSMSHAGFGSDFDRLSSTLQRIV